jgi:hypothetical protein
VSVVDSLRSHKILEAAERGEVAMVDVAGGDVQRVAADST